MAWDQDKYDEEQLAAEEKEEPIPLTNIFWGFLLAIGGIFFLSLSLITAYLVISKPSKISYFLFTTFSPFSVLLFHTSYRIFDDDAPNKAFVSPYVLMFFGLWITSAVLFFIGSDGLSKPHEVVFGCLIGAMTFLVGFFQWKRKAGSG